MAERRMFSKNIVQSSVFMKMPGKMQLLYYHLGMQADDDGFVNAPDIALWASKASWKDLDRLVEAGYLYRFDQDVVLIRHWHIHNMIRKDRYKQTQCQDALARVHLDQKNEYTMSGENVQPVVNQRETQDRSGKDKTGKDRIDQDSSAPGSLALGAGEAETRPEFAELVCFAAEEGLTVNVMDFYHYYRDNGWMENGEPVRDWRALLRGWERRNRYAGTP